MPSQVRFLRNCWNPLLVGRMTHCNPYRAACECDGAVGFVSIEEDLPYAFIHARRPCEIVQIGYCEVGKRDRYPVTQVA